MDKTMLTLKPGVTLAERGGQTGLVLNGHVRFARDARQAALLRALAERLQTVENLTVLLRARDGPPENDYDVSLTIAGFILDFGEYLKD